MALKLGNGLDLQNQRAQNVGSPSVGSDAVNKTYVDNALYGLDWKEAVRVATTGNIALTGTQTIDGIAVVAGDRVLVKNQTAGAENGIYVVAAGAWARSEDANLSSEVTSGLTASVSEGTVNGDKTFNLVTDGVITLGTTALTFSPLAGGTAQTYVAGAGLAESPAGTFNVTTTAGSGITVGADTVAVDFSVVARKLAFNVGDGTATAITLTHGLGTRDVGVDVYTNSGVYEDQLTDVERPSINTVLLRFATAPASGALRAVIVG